MKFYDFYEMFASAQTALSFNRNASENYLGLRSKIQSGISDRREWDIFINQL